MLWLCLNPQPPLWLLVSVNAGLIGLNGFVGNAMAGYMTLFPRLAGVIAGCGIAATGIYVLACLARIQRVSK